MPSPTPTFLGLKGLFCQMPEIVTFPLQVYLFSYLWRWLTSIQGIKMALKNFTTAFLKALASCEPETGVFFIQAVVLLT